MNVCWSYGAEYVGIDPVLAVEDVRLRVGVPAGEDGIAGIRRRLNEQRHCHEKLGDHGATS